jgi:hypothetical protein
MAGPQGVTPVAPVGPVTSVLISPPGALPPDIHGRPANPAHGQYTWDETPLMPWQIVPGTDWWTEAGVQDQLLGQVPPNAPPGQDPQSYADPTATLSHGAPWPWEHIANAGAVNDIEATANQARANAALHATDSGDPAAFTSQPLPSTRGEWERMGYVTPGTSGLELPGEQMIGNGNTGWRRDSGYFVPGENANRFGMDSSHVSRYRDVGDIPAPPNSTQGAQRPMVIQPASRRSYPVGPGSPFEGQVPGQYGVEGMYGDYVGLPSDYQASPDPLTGPPLAQQQPPGDPVWGAGFLG